MGTQPFVKVLCYPSGSVAEAGIRIKALRELGVEAIVIGGPTEVAGLKVLGKGHVGVVVRCLWSGREAALKIRRTDADRESIEPGRPRILSEANRWSLGPTLYRFFQGLHRDGGAQGDRPGGLVGEFADP